MKQSRSSPHGSKTSRSHQALLMYPATMGRYDLERVVQPIWANEEMEYFDSRGRTVLGRGHKTSDRCGEHIGFYQCPEDGYRAEWNNNCSKAGCPICFENWLTRRTRDSGKRLEQIARLLHRAPNHIILSAAKDWDGSTKSVLRMAKAAGIIGGCKIYHAWRFREKATGQSIAWKRTDINPLSKERVPSYGVESPHWHILGWGYLTASNEFYQKTGWTYKNVGPRKDGQLYATLYYQLSHATIEGRRQSLTWFGIVANNKLAVNIEVEYHAKLCPICKSEMLKFQYYDTEWIEVDNKQKVRMKYYRFKEA